MPRSLFPQKPPRSLHLHVKAKSLYSSLSLDSLSGTVVESRDCQAQLGQGFCHCRCWAEGIARVQDPDLLTFV